MGQKTHPIGFRLGIVKDWQARWFAANQRDYRALVSEDLSVRSEIKSDYPDAGVSRVDIERGSGDVTVTIHTARPGIVIGRGGQRVEELRKKLEIRAGRRVRLNVQEIRQPELDAYLVARNISDQLERRIAFRRAIRQTLGRTMQAGAQGIKIICSGRLGGADIARSEKAMEGRVPLHTLRADIDYGLAEAATEFGRIGVKVWIYRGDILPDAPADAEQDEYMPSIEVTLSGSEQEGAPAAGPGGPPAGPGGPPPVRRGSAPAPSIVQSPRGRPPGGPGRRDDRGGRPPDSRRRDDRGGGRPSGPRRDGGGGRPQGQRRDGGGRPQGGPRQGGGGGRPQGPRQRRDGGGRPPGPRQGGGGRPQGPRQDGGGRPQGPRQEGGRPPGPRQDGGGPPGPRQDGGGPPAPPANR